MNRLLARRPLVMLLVGTACALQKPTVAYKSASLAEVTLSGATLNVVTTVNNPNSFGISLADVDYRLSIEGHPVAAGRPPEGLQIAPGGATDVTLPATFRFVDLGQAATEVLSKGTAAYRAEGTVGVSTPVGVLRFPLSHEGTVPLPEMPGIALGTPRLAHVGLDQIQVELPVTLTAKGSYPIPLQGLEAAVSIGSARVGSVSAKDLGTLEPGVPRSITLPLSIPLSGAYQAAQAILKGGSVPLGLDGQLHSGPTPVPFSFQTTAQFRR